jgi:hypothetical protein
MPLFLFSNTYRSFQLSAVNDASNKTKLNPVRYSNSHWRLNIHYRQTKSYITWLESMKMDRVFTTEEKVHSLRLYLVSIK